MRLVVPVLFMMICAMSLSAGSEPKVEIVPWPAPAIEAFDPDRPPADLSNPAGGESIAAVIADGVQIRGNWNGSALVITGITSVRVAGMEPSSGASRQTALTRHELGHDALFRWCFEHEAPALFDDAFRGLPSVYTSATSEGALARATSEVKSRMEKALGALMNRINALNNTFDDLTKHGASETVSAEKAVDLVKSSDKP